MPVRIDLAKRSTEPNNCLYGFFLVTLSDVSFARYEPWNKEVCTGLQLRIQ